DSIHAPVGHRDHGRDHLVMTPLERQVGGQQRAVGREGMAKRLRNQRVRGHDEGAATFGRMDRNGVLLRIERFLPLHCLPQFFVSFRQWNRTNPGHGFRRAILRELKPRHYWALGGTASAVPFPTSSRDQLYTQTAAVANSRKMLRVQLDFIAPAFTQSPPGAGSITLSRDRMQEGSD